MDVNIMPTELNEILTATNVAKLLHLNLKTIQKMAREGKIPAFRVGRQWRFRKAAIDEWIDKCEKQVSNSRHRFIVSNRRQYEKEKDALG